MYKIGWYSVLIHYISIIVGNLHIKYVNETSIDSISTSPPDDGNHQRAAWSNNLCWVNTGHLQPVKSSQLDEVVRCSSMQYGHHVPSVIQWNVDFCLFWWCIKVSAIETNAGIENNRNQQNAGHQDKNMLDMKHSGLGLRTHQMLQVFETSSECSVSVPTSWIQNHESAVSAQLAPKNPLPAASRHATCVSSSSNPACTCRDGDGWKTAKVQNDSVFLYEWKLLAIYIQPSVSSPNEVPQRLEVKITCSIWTFITRQKCCFHLNKLWKKTTGTCSSLLKILNCT